MKFNVVDDFCVDAIFVQDFQNKHHSVTFEMKGKQPPITISKIIFVGLLQPLKLNLLGCSSF